MMGVQAGNRERKLHTTRDVESCIRATLNAVLAGRDEKYEVRSLFILFESYKQSPGM
jgi:hypothetical protein